MRKDIVLLSMLLVGLLTACNDKEDNITGFQYGLHNSWKLTGFGSVNGDNIDIRVAQPEDCESCFIVTFNNDGMVSGNTTTNDFVGNYSINANKIRLENMVVSKVGEVYDGCEFYQALIGCSSFLIANKQLYLFYNYQESCLIFQLLQK